MKKLKQILIILLSILSFNIVHAEQMKPEMIEGYNPLYYPNISDELSYTPSLDYSDTTEITPLENIQKAVIPFRAAVVDRQREFAISIPTTLDRDSYSNDELQSFYTRIAYAIIDELMIHTGKGSEGDYISRNYAKWETTCGSYEYGENNTWTFSYNFRFYFRTSKVQEDELTEKLAQVYKELDLNNKNTYEKVSAIYKYITDNVTYDYENLNVQGYSLKYTAYAALINGTSVCQGYALLFYRMALDNNVDARYISGTGNGGPHGWNIVKIGNYYYNLDSTWDAGRNPYDYFLKSNENFADHVRNNEYDTTEFNKKYPMSPSDYKESTEVEKAKGDLNGDGEIGLTDVLMLLKAYFNNTTDQYTATSDMNDDGKTDLTDILMLLKVYFSNN